jgi:hypothetical protein
MMYTKGKICKKARSRGLNEIPILLHATLRQYFANRRIPKFQRKWVVTLLSPTMPLSPPRPGAPTLGKTFCSIFGEQDYLYCQAFATVLQIRNNFNPGSEMEKFGYELRYEIPDNFPKAMKRFLGLKILKFFDTVPDLQSY